MQRQWTGEIALLTAGILYGFIGVLTKLITFQIPIFYQAWIRCFSTLFVLIPLLILFKHSWKRIAPGDTIWFILRSLCGFIGFFTGYVAFTRLDIGTVYFLSYASSLVVGYLLGIVLFKEKLTKSGIIAFVLAFLALGLIYSVHLQGDLYWYITLAVISGCVSPGWNVCSKKISSTYSNIQLNIVDTAYAFLFPFIASFIIREQWIPITWTLPWIYSLLMQCIFIATGFLVVYGFKKVSAQTGMVIMLIEIVAGVLFGYFFFSEAPSFGSFIGGILIIFAMLIRTFSKDHHEL